MLTRDFLLNADCKTAFGAIEESLLWSAEQRAASLAATLACRPDDGSVWIDLNGTPQPLQQQHAIWPDGGKIPLIRHSSGTPEKRKTMVMVLERHHLSSSEM